MEYFSVSKTKKSGIPTEEIIRVFNESDDLEEIKEVVSNAEDRLYVSFASVDIRDKDGEHIPIDLMKEQQEILLERGGPITDEHTNRVIGRTLAYKVLPHPLNGKNGILHLNKIHNHYKIDDQVWQEIRNGERTGSSVGGLNHKVFYNFTDGQATRELMGFEHLETASVYRPANQLSLNQAASVIAKSEEIKSEDIYKDWYKKYGATAQGVGWVNKFEQLGRFDVTAENLAEGSVLDIGAGFGDFYNFLIEKELKKDYLGVERIKEFSDVANSNNIEVVHGDLMDIKSGTYDNVIALGTLHITKYEKIESPKSYITERLDKMWKLCNKRMIFTLIHTGLRDYHSFNKAFIEGYAKNKTGSFKVLDSRDNCLIAPNECFVVMEKTESNLKSEGHINKKEDTKMSNEELKNAALKAEKEEEPKSKEPEMPKDKPEEEEKKKEEQVKVPGNSTASAESPTQDKANQLDVVKSEIAALTGVVKSLAETVNKGFEAVRKVETPRPSGEDVKKLTNPMDIVSGKVKKSWAELDMEMKGQY